MARRLGPARHFVEQFVGLEWHDYEEVLGRIFNKALTEFRALGVIVMLNATLNEYVDILRSGRCRAVTLFSHTVDARYIEFADGMHHVDEVICALAKVAPLEQRVLDFQACRLSKGLAPRLRALAPSAAVRSHGGQPNVARWIYYYRMLYKIICKQDVSFSEAADEAFEVFEQAIRAGLREGKTRKDSR